MTRRDFITPPDIPEGLTCRTLKIPSSKDWLGIFNWAVLTTVDAWRYEQLNETDLTIEEVVAKCQEILNEFWSSSTCNVPTQPGGAPIIGFGEFGEFQQLYDSGWGDPSGDYAVPPIPPRTTGTEEEKRCLAAANAANVLKVLYEQLSDDYAGSLSEAEAFSNFVTGIALLIGAWLGFAIAAIIAIYRIMFQVVYETIEFVTADYWTTEFNDKLQCAFYTCASVDSEGVVTFDLACVIKEIASTTDVLSDPFGVLLFGQVQAILNVIGKDGLEAAGATTAITTADCSACPTEWCYTWVLSGGSHDGLTVDFGSSGTVTANGVQTTNVGGNQQLSVELIFAPTVITALQIEYHTGANRSTGSRAWFIMDGATEIRGGAFQDGTGEFILFESGIDVQVDRFVCNLDTPSSGAPNWLITLQLRGLGVNPFGEDNCLL